MVAHHTFADMSHVVNVSHSAGAACAACAATGIAVAVVDAAAV